MSHHSTIFAQFLRLVPRHEFDALAKAHHSGAPLRRMSRFSQFVGFTTAHLSRRHSLRDVVANLSAQSSKLYHLGVKAVTRSSFARVNEEQPYTLYEALFAKLYDRCERAAPRHGFKFKNKLYSLDSSLIDLSLKIFPWAHLSKGKAAMKLHVALDHDGYLPAFSVVTHCRTSDLEGGRSMAFPKGSIVVFDKGYSDYAWLKQLEDSGVFFVTRARANILAKTLSARQEVRGNVISDERIELASPRPRAMGMKPLRLVGYVCPDTGREYQFLTNIEHLSAQTIADIYKSRWQIELFFKWIKQNLKLKGILGTSKNAVLTQIWAAMCVCLLLAWLKFSSRIDLSMQQINRLLQLNLFLKRDLMSLLKNGSPPPDTPSLQYRLSL